MRTQMFGLSIVLAGLIGCGGGGGSKSPDAKIFLDAPIDATPACAVMDSLGGLNLGSMAMPVSADWFDVDRMGSLAGRKVLSVGGRLPSSTAALIDILIIDYVKPAAGGFVLNTAINFDPNPAAAPYVAASYVFGDFDMANGNSVQNFYWAKDGSITVTAVGEANGAAITGSVAATNYREIDDQDADVPNGCVTALTGLNFTLSQMMMAFQPSQPQVEGGLVPLTSEEWKAARQVIDAKMANRR